MRSFFVVVLALFGSAILASTNLRIIETETECTSDQKSAFVCFDLYEPVCGDDGVTYSNSCTACKAPAVSKYTTGSC